jgi:hypothetical protein
VAGLPSGAEYGRADVIDGELFDTDVVIIH